MALSKRLQAISSFVDQHTIAVDIGSDHGYLPAYLMRHQHVKKMYATEYSLASFTHLKTQLQDEEVTVYQADGLKQLPQDVTTIIISGMGGLLIQDILSELEQYPTVTTLILGPQRDEQTIRLWLQDHQWKIVDETLIHEHTHYYPIIKATRGTMKLTFIETLLGPKNIIKKDPVFLQFLHQYRMKLIQLPPSDHHQNIKEWIDKYVKN
jgi:tRNA (adenine22-N1)-methyltransferase